MACSNAVTAQYSPEEITVASMARLVARDVAPAEDAALTTYLVAYERDPAMLKQLERRRRDEATGFGGLDGSMVPVIVSVVSTTLTYVAQQVTEAVRTESSAWIQRTVGRLFRKAKDEAVAPVATPAELAALTPAQLQSVRAVAHDKALSFGLDERSAANMADAVVGHLAVNRE